MNHVLSKLFCFRPTKGTGVVIASVFIMWLLYYMGSNMKGTATDALFIGGIILGLLAIGLAGGIIFRLVKMNIFVLWPFAWGVGSAIGTVSSSHSVNSWSDVSLIAIVVVIQLAILNRVLRRNL